MAGQIRSNVDAKQALEKVQQFLAEWRTADEADITISSISGGYVNTLYLVENKKPMKKDPSQVILRFYGGNLIKMDSFSAEENPVKNTETEEVMIFFEQSERGLGPHLYGVFPGGRIEEYIDNHTLNHEEALTPVIMKDLAINFARFQSLKLPFPHDKVNRMGELMNTRSDKSEEDATKMAQLFQHPAIVALGIDFSLLAACDFKAEFTWLFTLLHVIPHREGFNRFDTNFLNCLVRNKPEEGKLRTVLVDYEMSIYAFRGLDLGGHFVNHMLKWNGKGTKDSGYPFPSEEKRREFLKYYLEEIEMMAEYASDERDTVDHVLMESDMGVLFFCLFFTAGTLKYADKFIGEPTFFTIIPLLLKFYMEHKKVCQAKYKNWP